ncbi:Trehalose transport system permease protein SugB [Streptomyces sp. RB5]|uniref:Trehalose transport system permease protein SugB n=1 Tax=Streptomyces smaragdinus TaxID=2585196 RepID=A0A7K0CPS8_9ACTN|nr:carbohydrate ABC transporter permease [Streptomyces smaragdinus]MQY14754.1 Trehalose transport system permease protein SugB [Streptomyces smaragdinus]
MTQNTLTASAPAEDAAPPAVKRAPRRGERRTGTSLVLHLTLIVASVIAVFPVAWIAWVSFGPDKTDFLHPGDIADKFSLSNYSTVLGDTEFTQWFLNSMIVGLGTCALGVFVSASAGYAVSRMRFPGHRPLMWTFLVTQMFPIAILIVPLYNLAANLGLLDTYWILILANCTTAFPYCAFLLKGYFDTIPVEIDEAGRVDGLTPFGTFYRLVLPLARPGLAVAAFYTFLTAWGEFAFASVLMLSEDKYTLPIGLATFVSEHDQQWNLMAATGVLIGIPAAVFFYLIQRHLVAGLTAGASKS